MNKLKKFITLICLVALCLINVPTFRMLVYADGESLSEGTYVTVMRSAYSGYFLSCQPNNAVVLEGETKLDKTADKYAEQGYWFLPRLNYQYYYLLEENDALVYVPGINALKAVGNMSKDEKVTMQILATATDNVLETLELSFGDEDYECPENQMTPTYTTIDNMALFSCNSTYYNPDIVFAGGYVTESHFGIPKSISSRIQVNTTLYWTGAEVDEVASGDVVDLKQYESTHEIVEVVFTERTSVSNSEKIARLAASYLQSTSSDIQPVFKCADTFSSAVYSPESPGDVGTAITFTFVCDSKILSLKYDPDASAENYYNHSVNTGDTVHLAAEASEKVSALLLPSTALPSGVTLTSGNLYVTSAFDETLLFSGASYCGLKLVDFNKVTSAVPVGRYTVKFSQSSDYTIDDLVLLCNKNAALPTPSKAYYTFAGWFTDIDLTTKFSTTGAYASGSIITVYPKWTYTGGNYTVRYYDSYNNTNTSETYKVIEKPQLPQNPSYTGYLFKNWMIVNATSDVTGQTYDPGTFMPRANTTYIFKAAYAVSGVIKNVTTSQSSYYVGQNIDKSKFTVIVQIDDAGTTKTLAEDEFTISPSTVTSAGTTTVTVKYTATGATASVKITGVADSLASIMAKYNGADLAKGTAIPTSHISVTGIYASGALASLTGWTISPSVIRAVGANSIKVTYGTCSTTININGIADASAVANNKELSSISAEYNGATLVVGNTIPATNFKVVATYKDGTTSRLASTDFNYTPNYAKVAGTNTIVVTYSGLSTTCTVDARDAESQATESPTTDRPVTTQTTPTVAPAEISQATSQQEHEGKGASPYYIKGHTILNIASMGMDQQYAVDLQGILANAEENAVVEVNLYNGYVGNILNEESFAFLRDKSIVLYANLLDTQSSQRIGQWVVNGKSVTTMTEPLDFNVEVLEVLKAAEVMYAVSLVNYSYPVGTTLTLYLPGSYPTGTYLHMYATNSELASSRELKEFLWSADGAVSVPLSDCPYFAITDRHERYEDGSDLTVEHVTPELAEQEGDAETESVPETDEPVQDDPTTPAVPVTPVKSGSNYILLGIVIAVCVLLLSAVGLLVLRLHKGDNDDLE